MPATTPLPPLIEVTHLPSASSFYAAITQPLGLQYLFSSPIQPSPTAPPGSPPLPSLHFGVLTDLGPQIVFSLVSRAVPRPALITLAAASPQAVTTFHGQSLLAHKLAANTLDIQHEDAIARTTDFDGNMIEAIYTSRAGHRVPTIHTVASEKEARRVLEWQEDVARSISDSSSELSASQRRAITTRHAPPPHHPPPPITYHRSESYPPVSPRPLRLVRRETVTTEHYRHDDSLLPAPQGMAREPETGITTKTVIGTVLGAAAGAAIAYAMVRSESPERIPQPVMMSRRASHGDARTPPTYRHRAVERVVECVPARSYISARDGENQHVTRRPEYVTRHTAPVAHRDLGRIEEGARMHGSRHSSRHGSGSGSGTGSRRSRSEVGTRYEHRPLTILPPRERSPGSGSHHSSHRSHHTESKAPSARSGREKAPSYVSARSGSHRTESTIKPSSPSHRSGGRSTTSASTVQYIPPTAASRTSTTTIRVMSTPSPPREREEYRDDGRGSERRSAVSARQVPLPRSVVSGIGYAASVAPSDSVSSVGSKRERERLRERMGRGGGGSGLGY